MALDALRVPRPGPECGAGRLAGPLDEWPYDVDRLTEVRAMGAANHYPPVR